MMTTKKKMENPFGAKKSKQILAELEQVALDAGKLLIRYNKKKLNLSVSHKKGQGVASAADIASEKMILRRLKSIEKTHQFSSLVFAEEDSFKQSFKKNDYHRFREGEFCWSIDPLDGTNNYLSAMDYYGVSLSLLYYGSPFFAVVYRPETGECFSAIKGLGSFKQNLLGSTKRIKLIGNQEKIKTPPKKLESAVLVTGFAAEKGLEFDREFEVFKAMMQKSRAVRRMGSAALDLCYVAEGIFDGFWERGLAPWDMSAASLICEESGVKVSDYNGKKFDTFGSTIISARTPLHRQIMVELAKVK